MVPPRQASIPDTEDEITTEHRIENLETGQQELRRGQAELRELIGRPPDPSRGTHGTGMAGTLSQVATDVRELRTRGEWPTRALKALGMLLAVAVPLSAAVAWAASHLRYTP